MEDAEGRVAAVYENGTDAADAYERGELVAWPANTLSEGRPDRPHDWHFIIPAKRVFQLRLSEMSEMIEAQVVLSETHAWIEVWKDLAKDAMNVQGWYDLENKENAVAASAAFFQLMFPRERKA